MLLGKLISRCSSTSEYVHVSNMHDYQEVTGYIFGKLLLVAAGILIDESAHHISG